MLRPKQTNCQVEPAYPGLDTVVFALSNPYYTCHAQSSLCEKEYPHLISQCGEFNA